MRFLSFQKLEPLDILISEKKEISLKINNYKIKEFLIDKIYIRYTYETIKIFFSSKFFSLSQSYKLAILKVLKPKIIISNNLSGKGFEYKFLYPKAKSIIYQFGYLNKNSCKRQIKSNKYFLTDYFLAFHKKDINLCKKYYKTKFIESGSIRNNCNYAESKKIKKNKILFISEFNPFTKKKFINNNLFVLKVIQNYCILKKLNLEVALRMTRQDKQNKNFNLFDEIKFYNKYLQKKITSIPRKNSFELAQDANLTITLNSNLGVELLSRGKKVLFFYLNSIISKDKIIPYIKKTDSICSHNNKNIKKIFLKLDKILKMSTLNWKKKISKNIDVIKFDQTNSKLKKLIIKILKNEKKKESRCYSSN